MRWAVFTILAGALGARMAWAEPLPPSPPASIEPQLDVPIAPSAPLAPSAAIAPAPIAPLQPPSVSQAIFTACHGAERKQRDKTGLLLCMGEGMAIRCADDAACRASVRAFARRELGP